MTENVFVMNPDDENAIIAPGVLIGKWKLHIKSNISMQVYPNYTLIYDSCDESNGQWDGYFYGCAINSNIIQTYIKFVVNSEVVFEDLTISYILEHGAYGSASYYNVAYPEFIYVFYRKSHDYAVWIKPPEKVRIINDLGGLKIYCSSSISGRVINCCSVHHSED